MNTFYMVEMHYPLMEDRTLFINFYAEHISMLLTIDGFLSAQRFECTHEARSPFLAIYRIRGPEVMTSKNYTSKAGRGSVDPAFRAKMTNWDRNLVQGEIKNLDVTSSGWMILIDRLTAVSLPLPNSFTPLKIVGLDTTITERGVRIGNPGKLNFHVAPTEGWIVRTLKPIHQPLYSG